MQDSQKKISTTKKVNNVVELYRYIEDQGYSAYWYAFPEDGIESVSVQDEDGDCSIALDPWKFRSLADEFVKGLHEVGHCDCGAFYNRFATCDIRKKQENRADRRAIRLRLSAEDLDQAVADGCGTIRDLAEHFGVTDEFMKKAVCFYTYGNLDYQDYLPA